MGMDAKLDIWIGIREEDSDQKSLPKKIIDKLDVEGEVNINSLEFRRMGPEGCDNGGFGHPVLTHDWNFGVIEFDIEQLQAQINKLKPKVEKALKSIGIKEKIGVWLQTSYE